MTLSPAEQQHLAAMPDGTTYAVVAMDRPDHMAHYKACRDSAGEVLRDAQGNVQIVELTTREELEAEHAKLFAKGFPTP